MNQAIHTAIETARAKVANNAAWKRSVDKCIFRAIVNAESGPSALTQVW